MEIPSYKSYQNLYDYITKIIQFIKPQKRYVKVYLELIHFKNLIRYETNIKTMNMNFPFYIVDLNIHLKCLLHECSKYKFPKHFKKTIRYLHQYQMRLQKK